MHNRKRSQLETSFRCGASPEPGRGRYSIGGRLIFPRSLRRDGRALNRVRHFLKNGSFPRKSAERAAAAHAMD
jgi:hypothetical protein